VRLHLRGDERSVHSRAAGVRPRALGEDRVGGQAASATFWENEEDERPSRANLPRLVEEMSHLLAWDEVYQETFEVVHEQYPVERSEEASPT